MAASYYASFQEGKNMSTEVAFVRVKPGHAEAFLRVFEEKVTALFRQAGATEIRLYRSVTDPDTFVKTGVWESREARLRDFVQSPLYPEFVALVREHLDGPPTLDDYDLVDGPRA